VHGKKELRDIEGFLKKVKYIYVSKLVCVGRKKKKRTNLIFQKRREHSAKSREKIQARENFSI